MHITRIGMACAALILLSGFSCQNDAGKKAEDAMSDTMDAVKNEVTDTTEGLTSGAADMLEDATPEGLASGAGTMLDEGEEMAKKAMTTGEDMGKETLDDLANKAEGEVMDLEKDLKDELGSHTE